MTTPFSNSRRHPYEGSVSWRAMTPEVHTIQEFDELPGIYGIELQDRPNPNAIDIYFKDTGWMTGDGFTGLTQLIQINVSNPIASQFRVGGGNSTKIICSIADDGKEVIVDYEGGGTGLNLNTVTDIVADAVSGISIDNNPNWASPSTVAGATQDAIEKRQAGERKIITLADDEDIDLTTIFDTAKDGEYLIMEQFDPRTFVRFMFTQGAPSDATILESSTNFAIGDVDTNICLIQSTDDILFKNRLGNQLDFVVFRREC